MELAISTARPYSYQPDPRALMRNYIWRNFRPTNMDFLSLLEWSGQQRRPTRSVQHRICMGAQWSRWIDSNGVKMAQCGTHAVIQLIEMDPAPWILFVGEQRSVWAVMLNRRRIGTVVDGYFMRVA
jgi:hypothetical protein